MVRQKPRTSSEYFQSFKTGKEGQGKGLVPGLKFPKGHNIVHPLANPLPELLEARFLG